MVLLLVSIFFVLYKAANKRQIIFLGRVNGDKIVLALGTKTKSSWFIYFHLYVCLVIFPFKLFPLFSLNKYRNHFFCKKKLSEGLACAGVRMVEFFDNWEGNALIYLYYPQQCSWQHVYHTFFINAFIVLMKMLFILLLFGNLLPYLLMLDSLSTISLGSVLAERIRQLLMLGLLQIGWK